MRKEPNELLLFRSLFLRTKLTEAEEVYYENLEKGYAGELQFDQYLDTVINEFHIAKDVLLEHAGNVFQLDSVAIFQDILYMFEVKNYEGDFYVKGDRWYTASDLEIKPPLQQLHRSESLLRRFLQEQGCAIQIMPLLVFVNPEFTLYQADMKAPIILPTQIPRLLRELNKKPSKTNQLHERIAKSLLSHHISKPPISRKPDYSYELLRKGIYCTSCFSFFESALGNKLICKCGSVESVDDAIIRMVREFLLLFPDRQVTTNEIFDWCGGVVGSKRVIRKALLYNFRRHGNKRATYFSEL